MDAVKRRAGKRASMCVCKWVFVSVTVFERLGGRETARGEEGGDLHRVLLAGA